MSLRHPSLHNALCKRRSPAPCRAPSVSQCIRAHLWVYVGNLRRLIEEHKVQYLPPEMFPAQRWKAVGPWPRPCPPLAASITLSHALAQLFSRATQTDRTTSVSHMKKAFFLHAHPNMLPALWTDLGLKRKIQGEEAKGLFCDSSSRVNRQRNQLQPGVKKYHLIAASID